MEKIDGQIMQAEPSLLDNYTKLKKLNKQVLELSGQIWNWPICNSLTTPTLARILHLDNLYKLILNVPGSICEFGVHYGASANILINLKQLYEPRNINRKFFLFDTFEGFSGANEKDGLRVKDGDFNLAKDYQDLLQQILTIQHQINNKPNLEDFKIISGDATSTIDEFLIDSPEVGIAMAILDMDIYAPTHHVLSKLIPRLTKGSIIVLDEFNHPDYPGETVALREVLGTHNISLQRSNFLPHAAWFRWGGEV